MPKTIAIDEAGRGPVIGPLVITGVLVDDKDLDKLKAIGVKDSKLIQKHKRKAMLNQIKDIILDYKTIIVTAEELNQSMKTINLNQIEAIKAAEIINHFNKIDVDTAIIDCPSPNIGAYKFYIKKQLEREIDLRPEHKADMNYVSVGAASIIAKTTRDDEVKKLRDSVGTDFGSGYTSDPKTQAFLKDNFDKYPNLFRKRWKTWKTLDMAKKQSKLGNF